MHSTWTKAEEKVILKCMKAVACIMILLWSLLIIQPLQANFINSYPSSCAKMKPAEPSCSKKCTKPTPVEQDKDCTNNQCNPIMSCPIGNFYLNNHTTYFVIAFSVLKEKQLLVDDNRISAGLAECWHPPEG